MPTFNTRIQNKIDTYQNWFTNNPTPLKGEICIVTVPADTNAVVQEPAILIKVGNGTDDFKTLPFISGKAADVSSWAMADKKPTYTAAEIEGLADFISGEIQDSNTEYSFSLAENYKLKVQKKDVGGEYVDYQSIDLTSAFAAKADKVAKATAGNFAGLDSEGNLTDSGKKAANFATAAQGTLADSALQKADITTGSANGTIAVEGTDVAVKGLGSAAFTEASAYATSSHNHDSAYAAKAATEAHISNADIHVTAEEKATWNAKADVPFKPEDKHYLTFSSPNSFTLKVNDITKHWDGTLEYFASDKTWTVWDGTTTLSSVNNDGEYVLYLRGTGNTKIGYYDTDLDDYVPWTINGTDVRCNGNIETLLDYATVEAGQHPIMAEGCFGGLFLGCTSLAQAPALPATMLASNCYDSMFYGCTSLTHAPALPATTLAEGCYSAMFWNCTGLTQAPALPATTLAAYCYESMFWNCSSLTQVPALPATTLADSCYNSMFWNCSSLAKVPTLPATTLTNACYKGMFAGCTGLKLSSIQTGEYTQEYRIPITGTGTTATDAFTDMFFSTGGTFRGTPEINTTYYLSTDNMIIRNNDIATLREYVGSIAAPASHVNDTDIHVTTDDKSKWNTASTKAAANESAISAIKDGTTIDSFADVETALDGKQAAGDYATKTEAQGYADAKDAAIAAAKKAGDDAQADVDALETYVGTFTAIGDETTVVGYVDAKIAAIPDQIDYSVTVAESTPEGYAKSYAFSQCGKSIATINIPKDMVVSSGSVVTNPKGQPAGTYIKLVLANSDNSELFINVGDLIEYVTGDTAADGMITVSVDANHVTTATINDGTVTLAKLESSVQTAIGKAHTHENKALLDTYTQTEANLADAVAKKHSHANATVLDGISSKKVTAWDDAAAKAHTHGNKTVLDSISAEKVAAWDAAQANVLENIAGVEGSITNKTFTVSGVSTDLLKQGSETLIFNCGNSVV